MTASARLRAFLALAAVAVASVWASGQVLTRRATTLAAIQEYPVFFHLQPVLVRAELEQENGRATLVAGDSRMLAVVASGVSGSGLQEVRGDVWDLGRMEAGDPRLTGRDLGSILGLDPAAPWPRPGEVIVLNVTDAETAPPLTAPSVRNLALAPERYVDQRVTVQGQFRGRNLYADLPQAPPGGDGRSEFVIRSAGAAIWVTGKRPRGRGFNFDVNSRLDTRRWIEVSGTVRTGNGLVWIEADELAETSPQADAPAETVRRKAAPIPPEVLFSAPTEGEIDVSQSTNIRVQFSRDLDPATLAGNVRVSYLAGESVERGEPQPPAVQARLEYNRGARVLEITFDQPLARFRTVRVELTDGIKGTDGTSLKPYTLTFSVGGS
ncbi:MAG TPA: Ig-like domain-containing protein [Methylomirabilota bacterium]